MNTKKRQEWNFHCILYIQVCIIIKQDFKSLMDQQQKTRYFIGIDLGSSFIKLVIIDDEQNVVASIRMPEEEQMKIQSKQIGWAQQDPIVWWNNILSGLQKMLLISKINQNLIEGIGISYQMHGLVMVNKQGQVLGPANIWCDSRATEIGEFLNQILIKHGLSNRLLNHPSNFTLSKLFWVKKNQPQIYQQVFKILLPGDFIAYKMSGQFQTTSQGLSEGVLWDYTQDRLSNELLDLLQIKANIIPQVVNNFSIQCKTSKDFNAKFGLQKSIPILYRSGDQPNNAFSLNIMNPGEVAATAGTSGVIFSITSSKELKQKLRINSFLHVNHRVETPRIGKLLCINSCGSIYQWIRKNMFQNLSYSQMNKLVDQNESEGIIVIPFGNGSQRMMQNKELNCQILNIAFGKHQRGNIIRAVVEGIAFSFIYGAKIMEREGTKISVIRAGKSNLFECQTLCEIISTVLGAQIEIMDTNGSQGAAKAAALTFLSEKNKNQINKVFKMRIKKIKDFFPVKEKERYYKELYLDWELQLQKFCQKQNK